MRHDGKIHSHALLFLLLAATALVCSCKSVDLRVYEDGVAMTNARQEIKSKSQLVLLGHEKALREKYESDIQKLNKDLTLCSEVSEARRKRIDDLEGPKLSLPPSLTPPRKGSKF